METQINSIEGISQPLRYLRVPSQVLFAPFYTLLIVSALGEEHSTYRTYRYLTIFILILLFNKELLFHIDCLESVTQYTAHLARYNKKQKPLAFAR